MDDAPAVDAVSSDCDHAAAVEITTLDATVRTFLCPPCGAVFEKPPTDEQIRAYLDRNPEAFGRFLRREVRRDPTWFNRYLRQLARTHGGGHISRVLGPPL